LPIYEYQCKKCKHRFEKIQKFSDQPVKKCPECGGPVEQLLSAPAVQFKGTGWYVTDYAKKGGGSSSSGKSSSESGSSGDGAESSASSSTEKSEKKKTEKKESKK
jgi:putative FmdB family regulatory protein